MSKVTLIVLVLVALLCVVSAQWGYGGYGMGYGGYGMGYPMMGGWGWRRRMMMGGMYGGYPGMYGGYYGR